MCRVFYLPYQLLYRDILQLFASGETSQKHINEMPNENQEKNKSYVSSSGTRGASPS